MKKCPYCGKQYPDAVEVCPADLQRLLPQDDMISPGRPLPLRHPTSAEEARFWERMSFRQLAILFIRLQALWFVFYAIVDLLYLVPYFRHPSYASAWLRRTEILSLFLSILRIIMYFVAALLCIQYAEKILGWLVRNMVPRRLGPLPKTEPVKPLGPTNS